MKASTLLPALLLAASLPAAAQTELNTQPVAPAANPRPLPLARPLDLSNYRVSSLGIDLGWGGPYGGLGFSYAHLITPNIDLNAGLGIGIGGKIGFGARYFVSPGRRVSPYLGANISRSGRIDDVNITLDEGTPTEEKANYTMAPSGVLHLRGGLRWQPGRVGLLGTVGYGIRFAGDPVLYATNTGLPPSARMRNLVDALSPGGLEISLGMSIGLGR
ncbi:hypothetical protein J0X19_19675 [Hymenobacter sp. BT186]|uniref:Outer membrane protein beta-barrel domain-containing protein n=1 Tax=Hymenobacter telluris TaxID=2816474 RepID=A0A939JCH1_9BACT|nr:hypothetical protein [Hymenobacter telluris]MBO0360191.1 hypothetical protein [Hymenobacter telluris]MBW3376218.1 hypothetical protein [Hymenobacter norwichensis]